MFHLQPIDLPFELSDSLLRSISHHTQECIGVFNVPKQSGTITLSILDDERMRELNHTYRGIDSTTDVLSFHYHDEFDGLKDDDIAGEIVFSPTRLAAQAEEYGHSIQDELARLTVHGVFHILGYDHETDEQYERMHAPEQYVLERIKEEAVPNMNLLN